ncbi:MAG: hypothetical protein ACPG8W_01910 [Candidatus Promineifilaceae bacterium]
MEPSPTNYPQGVLPFLPMLYIAWADAVLSPTELETLKTHIDSQTWLTASSVPRCKGGLIR